MSTGRPRPSAGVGASAVSPVGERCDVVDRRAAPLHLSRIRAGVVERLAEGRPISYVATWILDKPPNLYLSSFKALRHAIVRASPLPL